MSLSVSYCTKISAAGKRIILVFLNFPVRIKRLSQHFYRGLSLQMTKEAYWKDEAAESSAASVVLLWFAELFVLLLECLGIGEIYETLADLLKYKARPLTKNEIKLAKSIYGQSIDYTKVTIDETAWLGPKQYRFCYVSFNTINCWGKLSDYIFIHEMMHIWQYQQLGAKYMIRALIAQHSKMGYDYGGITDILGKIKNGKSLFDYNFEQQADVVTDYFLLKNERLPQWGNANSTHLSEYEDFIQVVRNIA